MVVRLAVRRLLPVLAVVCGLVVACASTQQKVSSVAVADHVLASSCQQGNTQSCQQACDDGHPPSCVEAGRNAELGLDGYKSGITATAYYRRACDLGHLDGCYNAGYSLEVGLAGRKDVGCAVAMYKLACDSGHGRACMAAGMIHSTGSEHVDQDLPAAALEFQKGCALGYAPACKLVKPAVALPPPAPSVSVAPSASASAPPSASVVPSATPVPSVSPAPDGPVVRAPPIP
ncbi:MAG: sel1 repeat family protein [Myxococcales bacterium]|nr:sel1 repeat family protein [Myxococcales bacterium]